MALSLLRISEVTARTGLSRSTIYLRMSQGQFPKSVSLGGRLVAWSSEDIDNWVEDQISQAANQKQSA